LKLKIASSVAILLTSQSLLANETLLDDVTVTTASGYEQKLADAPASISVISKEELSKKPFTNLLDALKDIEGIDIGETRDKSGQGSISIRGMGGDYTLIMIDGKKQNNNGDIYPNNFGGFQNANLPPLEMIERIEVVRGPMSTLYGADAMGGVVNIITKKITSEWTGAITHGKTFQSDSQFGNDTTTDFALMGPLVKDKLGLSLRGSYYDKEASTPITSNGSTFGGAGKTVDNQNWNFGTSLTFTPNENHTIKADYDISKQKYDNTGSFVGTVDSYENLWYERRGAYSPRVGYAPVQRMEREQYSISHEAQWEVGKSTISAHYIKTGNLGRSLPLNATQRVFMNSLYSNYTDLEDFRANGTAAEIAEFEALLPRPTRTLESSTMTYDAKYELPLEEHFLIIGAQYVDAELEDGVFGMTDAAQTKSGVVEDYKQWALFAEDTWAITDNLSFTTGLRYDNHESFGSNLSPRGYAIYNLNDNWTFKGGVATGYKTPKTTDLFDGITGFGGQGTSPWVGNPNLNPEKSVSSEIAAYYSHEEGHNFNITIFNNDFEDKIENVTLTQNQLPSEWDGIATSARQKQNVGEAQIKGIELAGKYKITKDVTFKANYTYTDSQREDTGNPLSSTAKHLYNLTLDWQINKKWNTYINMNAEKDRWRGVEGLDYYEDYQVFNLGSSYKVSNDVTLNGRVNNLFDKDFSGTTDYTDENGDAATAYSYNLAQKRREFWISMNVKF
jgi:outer membrane receptor for ferrienterochelin and colicins